MFIEVTDAIKTAAKSSTQQGSTNWYENNNYVSLPDGVLSVNHVYSQIGASSVVPGNIFNIKYQIFLNDLYYYGALDLLNYTMTKTYLEDLSRIITPDTQIRFNKKQGRLYLDIDF